MTRCWRTIGVFTIAWLTATAAPAQPVRRVGPGTKGTINLPYRSPQADALGNTYFIYQGGWFRQQGNMPVYGEGGQLLVGGNQPSMNGNQARLEENGELVIENMQVQGATVTRRLLLNGPDGFIRVIDVFKNSGGQDLNLPITYRASLNYGLTSSQNVTDPRKAAQAIGVVATDGQGR